MARPRPAPGFHKDVRKEQLETFGDELGKVFYALWKEVVWLHDKWREYRELFGTNPERIELLNRSAGRFFGSIQESLWEDILLHITRVTDPPRPGGKQQLQKGKPLPEDFEPLPHI